VKYSQDKGSIYITVTIILLVILMLLSMLIIIAGRDVRTSDFYSAGIRAYYLAHTGIAEGIAWARSDQKTNNPGKTEENVFSDQYPVEHRIQWHVDYSDKNKTYTIISTGSYSFNNNDNIKVQRTLTVTVRVKDGAVEVDSWLQS